MWGSGSKWKDENGVLQQYPRYEPYKIGISKGIRCIDNEKVKECMGRFFEMVTITARKHDMGYWREMEMENNWR